VQLADMFKLAYKALIDRKIRSVLTILGITVGSAIILSLIASSAGLNAGIAGNIAKTGANILQYEMREDFSPPVQPILTS